MATKIKFDDKLQPVFPEALTDLQEVIDEAYYATVEQRDRGMLGIYNKAAAQYNKQAGRDVYSTFASLQAIIDSHQSFIHSIKTTEMATTKKATAAKSAAPKPAAKNAKKSAAAKPAAKKSGGKKAQAETDTPLEGKVKTTKRVSSANADGTRALTQKEQIVMLADQGKTINEIVEMTGFKKTNVQWYFSRLKLGKKK